MLRWFQSMPESSTAMPTPLPLTAFCMLKRGTAALPVASCSRLPERAAVRLGVIDCTSSRAARLARLATGTIADKARTDR